LRRQRGEDAEYGEDDAGGSQGRMVECGVP
jgi:hypothetical protein